MTDERLLPLMLIIIQLLCAIPYAHNGDWRHAIYWLAAAVLNICVTF